MPAHHQSAACAYRAPLLVALLCGLWLGCSLPAASASGSQTAFNPIDALFTEQTASNSKPPSAAAELHASNAESPASITKPSVADTEPPASSAESPANNTASAASGRTTAAATNSLQGRTLADNWRHIQSLLAEDKPASALSALDALAAQFGAEPEYHAALPQLLPLHAQLCLAGGRAADAVQLYQQWLALPQTATLLPQRIEILGKLATASHRSGNLQGTHDALHALIALAPRQDARSELARLQLAALPTQAGDPHAAFIQLQALSQQADYPAPLRTAARLQAIYLALQNNRNDLAADALLSQRWELTQMPALAQLSFAALSIAEYLLHQDSPQEALQALQLVTPHPHLLHLQRQRRADVERALQAQRRRQGDGSLQAAAAVQFLAAELLQIDLQLQALEQRTDFAALYFDTKARVFLRNKQPWQAAILFAATAAQLQAQVADKNPPAEIANEHPLPQAVSELPISATYNRLLALQQARRSQRLQAEAELFAANFPHHPLALAARSLLVEDLLQRKRYSEALHLLSPLLQQQSELEAVLRFHSGYANAFLGRYNQAQADFAKAARLGDPPLRNWALYWSGQSDVLAAHYARAAEHFAQALPQIDPLHPAYPYACFSHAQALYASGAGEQAQAAFDAFLHKWPQHERADNARLLLVEASVATGQTQAALDALKALVEARREPLAAQAVLRQGELLEQLNQPQQASAAYLHYLQNCTRSTTDAGKHYTDIAHRAVRTLHLLGEHQQAASLLQHTLLEQGNNPQAGDFSAMILLAAQLGLNPHTFAPPVQADTDTSTNKNSAAVVVATANVADSTANATHAPARVATASAPVAATVQQTALWLEVTRNSALDRGLPTFYARLSFALSRHHGHNAQSELEQAVLLQISANAQPEQLDEVTLQSVASLLAAHNHSTAELYLQQLEARAEETQMKPPALLWGQAQMALHAANPQLAASLLEQLRASWPTHSMSRSALMLAAKIAHDSGEKEQERQHWLTLLGRTDSTAAQRAQALLALARWHALAGDLPAAINHYQRIYTLYRTQEQAALAYIESAPLFEALGNAPAALASYEELLRAEDISLPAQLRNQAQTERERLLTALATDASTTSTPKTGSNKTNQPDKGATTASTPPLPLSPSLPSLPSPLPSPPSSSQPLSSPSSLLPPAAPTVSPQAIATHNPPPPTASATPQTSAAPTELHISSAPVELHTSVTPTALSQSLVSAVSAAPPISAAAGIPPEQSPDAIDNDAAWRQWLHAPVQVQLSHGAILTGDILGIEEQMLYLRLRNSDGTIGIGETALPQNRILRIEFGDDARFAHTDALVLNNENELAYARRKAMYLHRERALPFVGAATLQRFAELASEALQQGEPILAVRIAGRCLALLQQKTVASAEGNRPLPPTGSNSALLPQLQDVELLGLWHLGLREQAQTKAEAIVFGTTEHPTLPLAPTTALRSALPYAVLAAAALQADDADTALELALYPIVLHGDGQQIPLRHAATAYSLALAAAEALQQRTTAEQLQTDAAANGITLENKLQTDP